ncbi:invasion associated locus B family protein [Pseudovibrio sp. Tun.PSC04-5.I4]|uniref:invasion associated locus B family protein n=1 Tax=Pseudovibrio sp. Tun.PSC04-5.I4 TaxID=1798213 RepID=UPI000888ACF8|nr:invasion associated locus B family protein [Pseudovibrio sp. Tun.PSC04-5.I4]SDR48677.1 Invasion protein IalB, involved in pathogenesis [Pseudovibrio sp. Tun.PSC04-5.I4]
MSRFLTFILVAFAVMFHGGGNSFISTAMAKEEWSVQCSRDQCQMYAEIRLQNGALFNTIAFRKLNAKTYAGILKVPLGFHVPSGINIGIDDAAVIQAKLITCKEDGCEAAFTANELVIDFLKRGTQMSILLRKADDRKQLALNYSLMGFTRNWKEFHKRMEVLMP